MPTRTLSARKVKTERAAFLSDLHVPYHDPEAVGLALDFLAWFKPNVIWLVGDVLDFYSIPSRFARNPERILDLQKDLDQAHELLHKLRQQHRDARIVYLDGNHEHRLVRYLWEHPEVSALRNLQLPAQLGLKELRIEHYGYHEPQQWHGLLVEHGNKARGKSAYTAAAMLEQRGVSGISGHTHRLGVHYRTDYGGTRAWFENGCLCRLDPEYVIGRPDWEHGFTIGHALDDRFHLEQVPILHGRIFHAGLVWGRSPRVRKSPS